ncbi:hypothetical protein ACLK1T_16045 [Escherichia coli]
MNEGKPTLPLLHAMHHGTREQAEMIRTAIDRVTVAIFWNRFWKQ